MTLSDVKNDSAQRDMARLLRTLQECIAEIERGEPFSPEAILAANPDLEQLRPSLVALARLHHDAAAVQSVPQLLPDASQQTSGRVLGDFHFVREVGRGGMGIVYEAQQISLKRRVAVKVLPFAAVFDKSRLERFRNEVLAAASLAHANIVCIYAVGCDQDVNYYAMQYIEGQNLADVIAALRRLKLTLRDPERAVEYATDAVEFAPLEPAYWNTLGVACYRNEQREDAVHALRKSMELKKGGDRSDWVFYALARWELDDWAGLLGGDWLEQAIQAIEEDVVRNQ